MSTLKRVTKNELAWSSSALRATTRLLLPNNMRACFITLVNDVEKELAKYKSRKTINCHNTPLVGSSSPLLGLSMLSHCTENKTLA